MITDCMAAMHLHSSRVSHSAECSTSRGSSVQAMHGMPRRGLQLGRPGYSCRAAMQQHSLQSAERCEAQQSQGEASRRRLLQTSAAAALLALQAPGCRAAGQTPAERVLPALKRNFQQQQYYVTGKLDPDIFAPNCRFKDPTTDVSSVKQYGTAVSTLFDPAQSKVDLISAEATDPHHLSMRWRFEARLKIPGSPRIKPYTGSTVYTLDPDSGKIIQQEETWDISALDAFVSLLFPGFGAKPAAPVTPIS